MKSKEQILDLIESEDVEFIRLQFVDILGNLKNIAVTPEHMERVIDDKYAFDASALFDDLYDPGEQLYLRPDLDTFVILPWRPQTGKVGKFICDVCYKDGRLYSLSPRAILKKVVEKARLQGYEFMIDPDCEFFLFHTDDNGTPTTVTHEKAGYLDVGPIDYGENARRDMVLTLEELGFEIESSHHEKSPAQHEIDFTQAEALETADSLVTFKFAIRSIAKRFGLYATFMPKPRTDMAGSGLHLNISLYKDDENLFAGVDDDSVSETAEYFMNGILEHAPALCAITNPTVNSYKRILSGFDLKRKINECIKTQAGLLKHHNLLGETKVELRFPDPSANPYLAIAVCIAAGLDGIKKGKASENENSTKILPKTLKDAVDLMVQDDIMKEVLGEEFLKIYVALKENEWNAYMMQVSDWEVNNYLYKM